jgi:hypothetical protein
LWTLDSADGLTQINPGTDVVTIGSGRRLLDDFVHRQIESLRQGFADKSPELAETLAPYMLSFKLFRKFHSPERDILERTGVGGGFHFLYQTNKKEDCQLPTLLILADRGTNNRLMTWWMVRVVNCALGYIVEVFTPPGQMSVADKGKFRRYVSMDALIDWPPQRQGGRLTSEQQDALQGCLETTRSLPFYNICMIGATDPEYWNNTLTYLRNSDSDPFLIDREGKVSDRKVREIFRALYGKVGSG